MTYKRNKFSKTRAREMNRKSIEAKCRKRVDSYLREEGLLSPEASPLQNQPGRSDFKLRVLLPNLRHEEHTSHSHSTSFMSVNEMDTANFSSPGDVPVPLLESTMFSEEFAEPCNLEESKDEPKLSLPGIRLIDVRHFFSELELLHIETYGCSFKDMEFQREIKVGLRSGLRMKCKMCSVRDTISLTPKPTKASGFTVNTGAVAGAICADGLVKDEDAIVEIKCPATANPYASLEEAVEAKKVDGLVMGVDGVISLKTKHKYYWQIQGQLNIANKSKCYFITHTDNFTKHVIVHRDVDLWRKYMVPKLSWFYMHALLPEIVSPRYIRNQVGDIRDASIPWSNDYLE